MTREYTDLEKSLIIISLALLAGSCVLAYELGREDSRIDFRIELIQKLCQVTNAQAEYINTLRRCQGDTRKMEQLNCTEMMEIVQR